LRHSVDAELKRDLVYRAIITGKDSQYQDVNDLKGTKLGISRLGRSELVLNLSLSGDLMSVDENSGSQVMASVMALREKWSQADQPTFQGEDVALLHSRSLS
jgi:hypothetical protein